MTQKSMRVAEWALWLTVVVVATIVMRGSRGQIEQAHSAFVYILIVLGATAGGERWLGIVVALLGFLFINYFFQPPFDTLTVNEPLDLLALVAFLSTALVANHLLTRARTETERAKRHAAEIEHLSAEIRHAEALREANTMKDVLIASVSHDLRTPLTTIRALAQDIQTDGSRARTHAGVIVEQADRLGKMVADVLDLSRLRAGAFTMNPEINTAEDLLGAAMRQFSGVPDANRIETIIDYTKPALLGTFDFVQSLRVLTNLIENALRHSPRSTPVTITVSDVGPGLIFQIADKGPGVPPSEQQQIFEPFYRPNGSSADAGAAGLGLSIAKRLAESQGGRVTYADREGGGSVFTFEVPGAPQELVDTLS
ncbi:MAG TPA: ATP-binding protein [Gemmatimonadaceae bacterium]